MCPTDLIVKLAFLHNFISLMSSLKEKVLSITIPKFLAFALIPIVLFANNKVSNDDGCFLKWEVKCSISCFTRIALQHVLSVPCKNIICTCLKNFDRINRIIRIFNSDVDLGIISVEHAV